MGDKGGGFGGGLKAQLEEVFLSRLLILHVFFEGIGEETLETDPGEDGIGTRKTLMVKEDPAVSRFGQEAQGVPFDPFVVAVLFEGGLFEIILEVFGAGDFEAVSMGRI